MSNEPKALRFDDAPAAPAPKAAPAPAREPGAVIFGATPAGHAVVPAAPPGIAAAPRPLSFPPSAPSAPAAAPPMRATQGAAEVRPLDFSKAPPAPAPAPVPGRSAFGDGPHPMKSAAQVAAMSLEAAFYASDQTRVDRFIDGLLPFRQETVESWGAHTLEDCRAETLKATGLTRRFNDLHSAQVLKDAVDALAPKKGIKARILGAMGPSLAQHEASVRHLKGELEGLLREVRAAKPNAEAEGKRLAALLLALRAVAQACGTPNSTSFELVLAQRLDTLRAALTQASMAPSQLKAVEDTAALDLAQCDRLLTVTFSAIAAATGR